jgi:diguanylate cyclase (GGDEF)-like protein
MINVISATSQAERDRGETDMPLLDSSEAYPYEEIQKYNKVMEQSDIMYFEEDSEWGAAYTGCKPLANSSGKNYALICADISIVSLHNTVNSYVFYNVMLTIILGSLFGLILIIWLRHNITGPILALEKSARKFAEKSRNHKNPTELVFDTPNIHTGNEVESLARAISQMSDDMRKYMLSIMSAEEKIKSAQETAADMTLLAYKDALTHVGSKIAYDRAIRALEKEISENKIPFAIAMIDLNNLKNINDGYGHSNGNSYIYGACQIICSIFRHSPVFRIGGDEFVVILKNTDYDNRAELINQAKQKFSETESDNSREPWERFSAAVGIAEYHSGDTVDMVFKNADKDMYENKMSMKNKN